MREIKFRAWDKNNKQWIYCEVRSGGEGYVEFRRVRYLTSIETEEWQQYTGLKDKNGKEIYEGDILGQEGGWIIEVKYINGGFRLNTNHISDYSISKWYKVIGNIYENPELLKEQK